jgi:hypothetical protein
MLKNIALCVSIIAFVVCLIWLIKKPDWDSLSAWLASSLALIGLLVSKKSKSTKIIMKQTGGKNSENYQAKGDINIQK